MNLIPRFLEEEEEGLRLSLETLVLVLMLIVYITSGPLLRRNKIRYLKASGFTMIIGILFSLLIHILTPGATFIMGFEFKPIFFFTFVLPWIIFSAGYTTMIVNFLKYFKIIALFSLSGTLISFMIISICTYLLSESKAFNIYQSKTETKTENGIQFTLVEILQFSAALSATDCIASFSLFMEDDEEKLNAIGFGDSIINTALSLGLFKICSNLNSKEDKTFTFGIAWEIIYKCILLFIFSFIMGGLIGLLCALFLGKMKYFKLNRVQETTIVLLFAFISYILCEVIGLSSMISLLACGLFMSHYAYYNLAFQTREESTLISLTISTLAEALVFSSLGMNLVYYTTQALSISFIIWEIILIIISRIITIFVQIFLMEKFTGSSVPLLSMSHQGILTITGVMRGAVTFGLAITISTDNDLNKEVMITSVIYIVFLTNIVLNIILPFFSRSMRSIDNQQILQPEAITGDDRDMNEDIFTFLHPNVVLNKINEHPNRKISTTTSNYNKSNTKKVMDYDDVYILPKVVKDWPEVQTYNNELSGRIKEALKKWAEAKEIERKSEGYDPYSMEEVAKAQMEEINKRLEMKEINSEENHSRQKSLEEMNVSEKIKFFNK